MLIPGRKKNVTQSYSKLFLMYLERFNFQKTSKTIFNPYELSCS